jgi:uncharacterized protein (DUF488 family)
MRLLTIGHGTISAEEFTGLLRGAGVARLIDIRSAPGSRQNPQFVRAAMEQWLPAAGIAYEWDRALGGFRKTSPNSLNTALRHASFRGYADYMLTQAFTTAANDLLSSVGSLPGAVMCSESVWWRCHRRLLSSLRVRGLLVTTSSTTGRPPLSETCFEGCRSRVPRNRGPTRHTGARLPSLRGLQRSP